jgi:hypothetical protein
MDELSQINFMVAVNQSWSNSEVEPENNFTSEIEEVVTEQRHLIAEEMLGYPYPAGRYNISARFVHKRFPPRSILYKNWLNCGGLSITIMSAITE